MSFRIILLLLLLAPLSVAAQKKQGRQAKHQPVEAMPAFPGDLGQWMSGTVHYPDSARAKGIEGQCVVGFMVNEEGSVCNVELKQSAGNDELDTEALRVVRAMPRWTPGVQDGKNVRVVYTLPVRFKLEDSEKAKEK